MSSIALTPDRPAFVGPPVELHVIFIPLPVTFGTEAAGWGLYVDQPLTSVAFRRYCCRRPSLTCARHHDV